MASSSGEVGRRALLIVENLSVPFDRRVAQEARCLHEHGWTVEVICPRGPDGPGGYDSEPEADVDGVRVYRYPLATAGRAAGYLREYSVALLHTLRLAVRLRLRGRIDVVHLCNPPDLLFPVALLLRITGARVVFDHHDLSPELYLSRFGARQDVVYRALRALEWLTFRSADVVLSTNESYRAIAVGRGRVDPRRVHVVRSAPAPDRLWPGPPDPSLGRGARHVLCYLGVMGPQDGVDHAVHALARLAERRDDWHAVMVGSGDARPAAEALVREYGLADRVTFTGRVSDERVRSVLSTAAVCLAPDPLNPLNDVSTMNKIVEYMAMGRPTVSVDLTESRISAGEAAVYARPGDPEDFAALVDALLDDPERRRRMGEAGQARVRGDLSWESSKEALLAGYAQACGKGQP
ncbi:glycosyltransferase family 4 protein [Actinomycetospora termitidis]|uniref:Glycosyltransferase family 4 protein n=1 Tax=Actinomycetospora termitidis TaxID=3053470 RepID=A0ABT7MEA9_9PSEU|nr:glycosyltransferase family 4 protein [Actinomycetospora sp. Odt1-22]MDL5159001.1 glycosyltransferase family 4 protein [Actinomycetospora sp. Odt1-22]